VTGSFGAPGGQVPTFIITVTSLNTLPTNFTVMANGETQSCVYRFQGASCSFVFYPEAFDSYTDLTIEAGLAFPFTFPDAALAYQASFRYDIWATH
jgi:hypothetical protein